MTDRNNSIAPSPLAAGNPAVGIQRFFSQEIGADSQSSGGQEDDVQTAAIGAIDLQQCESVASVAADVEAFTRAWIGRIRRLIHRSSQLIERESLLAGAISRLDQQKAEWSKRTAVKEEGLRDQSKRLTEAWLEVEAQRRKAIQGARVAATGTGKSGAGPVIATPVHGNQTSQQPVVTPAAGAPNPTAPGPGAHVAHDPVMPQSPAGPVHGAAAPTINMNVPVCGNARPVGGPLPAAGPMMSVGNTPVVSGRPAPNTTESGDQEAFEQAEALKRQRIEEFKRMQRAIRSSQNK